MSRPLTLYILLIKLIIRISAHELEFFGKCLMYILYNSIHLKRKGDWYNICYHACDRKKKDKIKWVCEWKHHFKWITIISFLHLKTAKPKTSFEMDNHFANWKRFHNLFKRSLNNLMQTYFITSSCLNQKSGLAHDELKRKNRSEIRNK